MFKLPVGWAGRLALRRLLSEWRSLLTIIAGALLSASVGALIPLYTTAVDQVSMVEHLNQLPIETVHARANLSLIASQNPDFDQAIQQYDAKFRDIVQRHIGQPFPGWLNQIISFEETSALVVDPPDQSAPTTRAYVGYYDDWQNRVSLVEGKLPTDTPDDQADIEIVIPLDAQTQLGINVGDVLLLDQGGPTGGWPTSKNIRARVSGIATMPGQLTPLEQAYFMPPSPLRLTPTNGTYKFEFAALTTRTAFDRVATTFIPDVPNTIGWRLLFDHTRLPFPRSPEARQALFDLDQELAGAFPSTDTVDTQFHYTTGLIDWRFQNNENADYGALLAYERSVKSLDAPFGLLLLQVGALVLFFLLAMSALVRRGERRETAMLQSRGAMDSQIILIRAAEALIICLLAALAAPVVAQQLLIVVTPFFARYPNLPLLITPDVFIFSAIAAAFAFIALIATVRPVLRLPLITAGGVTMRSQRQQWWQRYYLDLLLIVPGILALWRLASQNTPLFTTVAGERTTDPLLLLAPVFLFLGLGSLLLRLFPIIAGLVARALAIGRALIGPLGAWQLSREPLHYGRITFLLALAVGIGWFATSFRATLDHSQTDQAAYRVGTDIRYNERDTQLNIARARPLQTYTSLPDVSAASLAFRRANVNFESNPRRTPIPVEVLAIDSATFAQSAYWRGDLGNLTLPRPPGQAISLPTVGAALPFAPQKIGMWAEFTVRGPFGDFVPDLDRLRTRTKLYIRLQDAAGTWLKVPFKITEIEYTSTGAQSPGINGGGSFIADGWAYFESDFTTLAEPPVEPVRLVSIYWEHQGRGQGGERDLTLTFSQLAATDAKGQKQPLDVFASPGWEFALDSGADSQGNVTSDTINNQPALHVAWDQNAGTSVLGILLNYPAPQPVPLVISSSLSNQMSLQPGQTLDIRAMEQAPVEFKIVGIQGYYPTLYDSLIQDGQRITDAQNHPFAIADRDSLLYALNHRPSAGLYADEVWIKAAPGADPTAILQAMQSANHGAALINVQTLPGTISTLQTDPLSLGLLGLMFLAFIIAMSLSVVGLLTYSALTATARRTEFGVLRALGLSSWRLIGQLAFEQGFVIGIGLLFGALLGALLSGQVVPRLAQDATGKNITPPFIVQVETGALLQYGLIIAAMLILVLVVGLLLVRRLSLSQTLRLGE